MNFKGYLSLLFFISSYAHGMDNAISIKNQIATLEKQIAYKNRNEVTNLLKSIGSHNLIDKKNGLIAMIEGIKVRDQNHHNYNLLKIRNVACYAALPQGTAALISFSLNLDELATVLTASTVITCLFTYQIYKKELQDIQTDEQYYRTIHTLLNSIS